MCVCAYVRSKGVPAMWRRVRRGFDCVCISFVGVSGDVGVGGCECVCVKHSLALQHQGLFACMRIMIIKMVLMV
jgi:hypothetical protein